jgi:LmbE family N-acetylglucosaminyl deacetylase
MPQTTQPFSSAAFEKFLGRLSDRSALTIPAYHVAVVVAHPHDATICGATLARLKGARIVAVTSGVGRGSESESESESAIYSLPASRTPQVARWHELIAAAGLAGCPPSAVTGRAVEDGKVTENLMAITRRIAELFHLSGTAIAITHPCERARSDRGSTGFAVHEAAALCRRKGQDIAILEMSLPSGRRDRMGRAAGHTAVTLPLTAKEKALKRRMLSCFEPKNDTATRALLQAEQFRVSHAHDFSELPRQGHISYGDETSDLSAAHWCDLGASAHRQLSGDGALRQHGISDEALVGATPS